jgi:quercetin dioxygenase-like cupin family protein
MRYTTIVIAFLLTALRSDARQPPPGVTREVLIDNDVALVASLIFAPGARESLHTHPFSAVQVQLSPGEVEMAVGADKDSKPRKPGDAWFIPKDAPHAAANVGQANVEFVTVAMKPHALQPMAPQPAQSYPGITRTPRFENDETRAAVVSFAPGSREDVHTHPFDLFVIQLTPGRVETEVGSNKSVADTSAGHVLFIRKNAPHAVGNVGSAPFDAMSVAVK